MRIRALSQHDIARGPEWLRRLAPKADLWRDVETRAVVALDGEEIVGTGRFFMGRVHNDRLSLQVFVAPDFRRRAIGTAIVTALGSLRPDPRRFSAGVDAGSGAHRFVGALGARVYQECPPSIVPTGKAANILAAEDLPPTQRGDTVDFAALAGAWVDLYAWTHAGWSATAPDFGEWLTRWLARDLAAGDDLRHVRVAVDDGGSIRAAALVGTEDDPPTVVIEARTADEPDGAALVSACARDALASLHASGHERALIDVHVTDPHAYPLIRRLPATGQTHLLVEITPETITTPA